MNKTITHFTLLAATIATLSACTPVTPQNNGPYTPPMTGNPNPPITNPNPTLPVTHPNSTTPPVTHPEPAPQQRYVVQLTASASQSKANNIRNTFAGKGYNAFVSPLMVNGRTLYRVQIGYYANKADADTTLNQMRQQYPGDTYVSNAIVKKP